MPGELYIIPVLLGGNSAVQLLPEGTLEKIRSLKHFIAEREKSARHFLKIAGIVFSQQEIEIYEISKHEENSYEDFLRPAIAGFDMGLLSEAGAPAIADPGSGFIYCAHRLGIKVIPLTGPSSILLALMASGLNGQSFCFHGYLPIAQEEKIKTIKQLEKEARQKNQTQLFIETPYRNNQLLKDLLMHLSTETRLCIAADITLENEYIYTDKIKNWKKSMPDLNKRPCVFLIL